MKNLNKNFFALSMVLCFGITTQAWGYTDSDARGGSCGNYCTWSYDGNGTLTITGNMPQGNSGDILENNISASWRGGDEKLSNNAVKSVVVTGSIKELPTDAFNGYKKLKSVDMNNGLETIGQSVFKNCSALEDIDIPTTVTGIGQQAFSTTGLTSLVIPDSVTTIGAQAFEKNASLKTIVVPDGMDNVNKSAFKAITSGTEVICQGSGNNSCNDYGKYSSSVNYFDTTNSTIKPASELQCYGDKHYWNGTNCVNEPNKANRTCSSSYKMNDGLCDRVRYTPAEAAKMVTNDNNNSVTITFKK